MSGLTERAEALRARIVDHEAQAFSESLAGKIRTRRDVAREAAGDLQRAIDVGDALVADGLPTVAVPDRLRSEAKRCCTNIRRMANKLERSDGDESAIEPMLGGAAVDDGRKVAREIVALYVAALRKSLDAERQSVVPDDVDATIPDIPGKTSLTIRLTRLRNELTTEVRLAEADLADIDGLRRRRARLTEAAAEWSAAREEMDEALAAFDPVLQSFLVEASGPDGAPAVTFTEDLREKLVAAGILDQFRIHKAEDVE